MQNAVLTDADRREIGKAWVFSDYDRESIEGQLLGGVIVAVYPQFGIDEYGNPYSAGLSIVYQAQGSGEIKTLDISSQNACSRDDEVTVGIEAGFVSPEYIEMEDLP